MTLEDDITSTDPETRASALIERGIASEQAGNSDAAIADGTMSGSRTAANGTNQAPSG